MTTLSEIGSTEVGLAWTKPFGSLPTSTVEELKRLALQLDDDFGFSREHPPRLRGAHHLAPQALQEPCALLVAQASARINDELAIHPSAHFGCSFNWTRQCLDGFSDAWHLDAAPLTLVVLLSECPRDFRGGDLFACVDPPEVLWERRRHGDPVPEDRIRSIGPRSPGQAVLLNGRRIPHSVGPVFPGETGMGRLTLTLGLYSTTDLQFSMLRGRHPSLSELSQFWSIERDKARALAALEQGRRRLRWTEEHDFGAAASKAILAGLAIAQGNREPDA